MNVMLRRITPIIVTIIAIAIFYALKNSFGWTLGLRTYLPVFIAIFLYTWYVLSLRTDLPTDSSKSHDDQN